MIAATTNIDFPKIMYYALVGYYGGHRNLSKELGISYATLYAVIKGDRIGSVVEHRIIEEIKKRYVYLMLTL